MVKKLEYEIFENEDIIINSDGEEAQKQYLSPDQLESIDEEQPEIITPKKERKKRTWTVEQKKTLVENLRAGRVKSIQTRNKNAKLKKLQQKLKQEQDDDVLYKDLKMRNETKREKQDLLDEVLNLKEEINKMKLQPVKLTNVTPPIVHEKKKVDDIIKSNKTNELSFNDIQKFKNLGLF